VKPASKITEKRNPIMAPGNQCGGQPCAAGPLPRLFQRFDHRCGEIGRPVCEPRSRRTIKSDSAGRHRSGNDGNAVGGSLEDLDPRSAAGAERRYGDSGTGVVRCDIGDGAEDVNAGPAAEGEHRIRRIPSGNGEARAAMHSSMHNRPDAVGEPAYSIDVWRVSERPDENCRPAVIVPGGPARE
jgi:hypothetical protein